MGDAAGKNAANSRRSKVSGWAPVCRCRNRCDQYSPRRRRQRHMVHWDKSSFIAAGRLGRFVPGKDEKECVAWSSEQPVSGPCGARRKRACLSTSTARFRSVTRPIVILERFAEPAWRAIEADWVAGRIGSRECLARQIDLVRATPMSSMPSPGKSRSIRTSWTSRRCARRTALPVTVVSDGLDRVDRGDAGACRRRRPGLANHLEWLGADRWRLGFPHARDDCRAGGRPLQVRDARRRARHAAHPDRRRPLATSARPRPPTSSSPRARSPSIAAATGHRRSQPFADFAGAIGPVAAGSARSAGDGGAKAEETAPCVDLRLGSRREDAARRRRRRRSRAARARGAVLLARRHRPLYRAAEDLRALRGQLPLRRARARRTSICRCGIRRSISATPTRA